MKIAIIGMGNFGYAFLKHFDYMSRHQITVYDRNQEIADFVKQNRRHPYFHKYITIENDYNYSSSLDDIFDGAEIITLCVLSTAIPEIVSKMKPYIKTDSIILNTAKALSPNWRRYSEIIKEILSDFDCSVGILAGGTIASDSGFVNRCAVLSGIQYF